VRCNIRPVNRIPVAKHGIVKRTWRNDAGQLESRFDATYRGPDYKKHSKTFHRLGDSTRWLVDQKAAAGRGGWIDPKAGAERAAT
jgi:hypothetical protein